MEKTNNLPIEVKRNLPIEQKRNNKRTINSIKRIGKIALNIGVAGSGLLLMSAIGGPIAGTIGAGMWFYGGINAGQNLIFKKQKNSMFVTNRNIKGEISLAQDFTNIQAFKNLKGLLPQEKAAVMGLEMFIGLQNYQQQYQDQNKKKESARNSQDNVYKQVFTAHTHGVNIKTMEALEKLGYLQIEKNEPTKRKSTLLLEKIGFKQYEEVKEIMKAFIIFDREAKKEYQKQIHEIKFRITDKSLDLDEIYKQYLEVKDTRGNNPVRKSIKRIGVLLEILKHRNIDIETDGLGMKKINYNAERTFVDRVKTELQNQNNGKSFREALQVQEISGQQRNLHEVEKKVDKDVQIDSNVDIERE